MVEAATSAGFKQIQKIKEGGNNFFRKGEYQQAIQHYEEGLTQTKFRL